MARYYGRRRGGYRRRGVKAQAQVLTGGTGDVNPEYFNMDTVVTQTDSAPVTAAGTNQSFQTPIPQSSMMLAGRSMVMELLKADFDVYGTTGSIDPPRRAAVTFKAGASTGSDLFSSKPHVLCAVSWTGRQYTGGQTGAGTAYASKLSVDLTDQAGHGIIYCGQKIFVCQEYDTLSGTNTTPGVHNVRCRVLYRWKNVGLTEYIGIVQSQLVSS